ncbi:hypothetical protein CO026_00215 [Candidatus Kaiserbacteria bacterium CG_4_9_14_0_2_um_filter_41_32]|uniref:Uncharacterized protein n=1 Tax=Candidatus Kaiserbacteria bacterium CG_4_9_14_0_2_um_filter_41_32 TaxID=1974601 RepID=A0A2M8FFS5_9BACT|nr:MAG: hypothetical protein CO026_00215 [Candidatus Kaiserbacteria bacterium CG_4_9_14_0_2_um_filter_41_32]
MVDFITTSRFTLRIILKYSFVIIVLGSLFSYIAFQARFMIEGPQITLDSEPNRVQNERIITLSGTAKNITEITLNGRQIFTDEYGHFDEALVLENGYTITTIAAFDRYGRRTQVVRSFVYIPASIITK